ncbi:ankyrin repeat domain-containing protein [Phaeosphaeriaceae sp. PMI808]|nr:ankyrin repeat domain-containing protein [Phaeosphaeriaceae sp. PMI808]
MEPLSVTASIIAVLQLSAKVLGYLNDVKDAPKGRTQCAIEILNLNSLLYKLKDHVENRDSKQPWHITVQDLAVKNGPLDQFKQALEILQSKIIDGGRLKKVSEALVWKFKKEEIASILDRIEHLKSLVEIALQMDHFILSQAIKDDTNFVRTHVPVIQSGVDEIRQDQDAAKHRRILEWISPTDYPAQQSDIIKRRQEGTGQWFLDTPQVATWLSEHQATLFCPGIPGAGKTMVAAIAIDHLLKSVQSSSHGVAYVYCNYKAQEEQDTSRMLAAILKQLVQARLSLVEPVERLHEQHADKGTRPSPDEIFGALRDVFAHYSTVYIVVDALDECQDSDGTRRQFLAKLRDLQAGRDVRLMATSRFIPDIMDWFNKGLKLEVQASKEDVKRFVAGQICRLPKCIQRDPALQGVVQEKIVEAVDGMFLLARLHTDSLHDKFTVKMVKSTLGKLSKGSAALGDAYKDAIQRIEGQSSEYYELAKKVLSWITYAKRPLTTTEICCALAVEPDEAELDPENIPDVEDLLSVCAGLVVVDQESAVIRLVHYTTQEYFERIRDAWDPGAQLRIASTCLTYLSFSIFKTGSCSSDEEFEERLQESQFLDYAAKHWGEHAVTVEDQICTLACSFLSHKELVSCATQALLRPKYMYLEYSQVYPKDSTGLHLIARFGLPIVLEALLLNQVRETALMLERRDSDGQTLLYLAAEYGHQRMVKLLLHKGADVNTRRGDNAQGGYYSNALYSASQGGYEQVVKLLLYKGAEVNAQGGEFGNALQAASYRGYEQVVKLLLDKGAEVNAQGGYYNNALQAASSRDYEQVVKLLLDKGAEVNAQGGYYGNALQAASSGGYEQVVKLLLDKGAKTNMQGGYYGNALYVASQGGYEQVVKLLLYKGADVNAQGGYYGNALQVASEGGYEQVVKLLLEKGADVNAQGGRYGNALQAALEGDHEQVVKLLLNKGAKVNAQGRYYSNALQAALEGDYEQVIELLLDKGAKVNAQDREHNSSALQAALEGDYEQGAKVNAQGGYYSNALQAALEGDYEQVIELLLGKGAKVNAQDREHNSSALQAALEGDYERVVELLLNEGATQPI